MSLSTPSIIKLSVNGNTTEFNGTTGGQLTLTDDSRSPLSVGYEVIENSQRMANGTMRKYIIAKKKIFSCSWSMLPTSSTILVDNNADANKLKKFYELYCHSPISMTLYHKKNNDSTAAYQESYNVYWTSFNYEVMKRLKYLDYWNVSVEFTEI